jgi:hypothetical protein
MWASGQHVFLNEATGRAVKLAMVFRAARSIDSHEKA